MTNITNQTFSIANFLSYSERYIETGTCKGESLKRALAAGYQACYTVELKKEFFEYSKLKFANTNTEFFQGKSTVLLPLMLIRCFYPAVIFLDAHPAGPNTAGHKELMAGDKQASQDWIITEELKHILAHRKDHLIIIDDQHGPDEYNHEYIKRCLLTNRDYRFHFFNEVLENGIMYRDKILVCNPNK